MPQSKTHRLVTEVTGVAPTFSAKDPVKRKRSYEESDAQKAVISWFDRVSKHQFGVPAFLLHAIPNGSALGTGKEDWQVLQRVKRAQRLIAEGLRPGVCDLFLAVPRTQRPDPLEADCEDGDERPVWHHGLYVEMKRKDDKTSKVSPEQATFIDAVRVQGYRAVVCRSAEEAISEITKYLQQ